ncbi:MAG TPA: DUF1566 domain-containing protein, partial [Thermoanaerobaculia bacterium]|nr:DUF1566 domain-containing protein [Thermoanaerobaculia bacterium]
GDLTVASLPKARGEAPEHQVETLARGDEKLVLDHTTGLMWQATGSYKHSSSGLVKAGEIDAYLAGLNGSKVGGYSDWRLPTVEELASVVAGEKTDASGALLAGFEPGAAWFTLTSDRVKGDDSVVWTIDIGSGDLMKYSSTDEYYVLLVRTAK